MKLRYLSIVAFGLMSWLEVPFAQAADASVYNAAWTHSGSAGLISGNYNAAAGDAVLGSSPTGNGQFAYVTTFGGTTGLSPLVLNDTEPGFNQTNASKIVSSSFSATANTHLTLYFDYVSTDGRGYEDYAWARLVSTSTNTTVAWLFTARSGNAPDNNGTSDYVPGHVLKDQVGFDDLDSQDPNRKIAATLNDGMPVIGLASSNTQWAPLGDSAGACWDVGTSCGSTGWVKSDYMVAASGNYFLEVGVSNWGDEVYDSALAFDFSGLSKPNFSNMPLLVDSIAAPVPEPDSFALMLAGLGFIGFVARRRWAHSSLDNRLF